MIHERVAIVGIIHILVLSAVSHGGKGTMCKIPLKTLTGANRAKKVLADAGIYSTVVGIDPSQTEKGCSYGVGVRCSDLGMAEYYLKAELIPYGKVIIDK